MSQRRNSEREQKLEIFEKNFKEEIAKQKKLQAETAKLNETVSQAATRRNNAIKEIEGLSTSIQGLKAQQQTLGREIEVKMGQLAKDTQFLTDERARLAKLEQKLNQQTTDNNVTIQAKKDQLEAGIKENVDIKITALNLQKLLENKLKDAGLAKQQYENTLENLNRREKELSEAERKNKERDTILRIGEERLKEVSINLAKEKNEILSQKDKLNKRDRELDLVAKRQTEDDVYLRARLQRINELIEIHKLKEKLKE